MLTTAMLWLNAWHQSQESVNQAKAVAAAKFAALSQRDLEGLRADPPTGIFVIRTPGTCSGNLIFSRVDGATMLSGSVTASTSVTLIPPSQPLPNPASWSKSSPFSETDRIPLIGGSLSAMAPPALEAFAASIPSQKLVHRKRSDGWEVARITGTFYWFNGSDRRAPVSDLPVELRESAEQVEMQERRTLALQRRIELIPWNSTNVETLRQSMLANLSNEIIRLHNLKAHLSAMAFKSGIPGCPSFVTKEADLAWQWGSSPTLYAPPPAPQEAKVELEPVQ